MDRTSEFEQERPRLLRIAAGVLGDAHEAQDVVADRPGAAWFNQGQAKLAFDFTVSNGVVQRIEFRAEPDVLATVSTRRDADRR